MRRTGVKGLRKPPLAARARLMGYAFFALSPTSMAVWYRTVRVRKCAFEMR